MKNTDILEKMKSLNNKQREIFVDLALAYVNGEITKEQLYNCQDGTETYDQLKKRYANV